VVRDFKHATLGRTGFEVFRLGISASYWPGRAALTRALDAGINYWFGFGLDRQLITFYRDLSPSVKQRLVLGTGAYNYVWTRQDLRRTLEKRLRQFRTDHIDVFHFLGIMKPEEFPPELLEQLVRLKDDGIVKAVAVSCHDRRFAGQLAASGALDVLMIRYNAAHRGAERDIFPFVDDHRVGVVSYTATRWTYLMRRPKGWPSSERIPTAGEAYRFALSDPHVDVVLTAPRNRRQLDENLAAMELGPLDDASAAFMRRFGDVVHEQKRWFM
jgi:aryl-alcohol dehydrogenase-like predicted oxidoreductase